MWCLPLCSHILLLSCATLTAGHLLGYSDSDGDGGDGDGQGEVETEPGQADTSVSVNTNEGFVMGGNDTFVFDTPRLTVQVDFGDSFNENEKGASEEEDDPTGVNDIYLPMDPFTLHHPLVHPEVTEFEYSAWYFLFFKPVNKSSSRTVDTSSVSSEVAVSLSSKLSVASSMFLITSVDKYKSNSISTNISLMSHSIPKLHHNLCNLQNTSPIFWIRGTEFRLIQIFHDKNQHLYINNKQSVTSPVESLGLLVTLTLGGLGMFLLVLAVTFLAAKTITKNDFERFSELEEILVEQEEYLDVPDIAKDIFIIDDGDDIAVTEPFKPPMLREIIKNKQDLKSPSFLSSLYSSWGQVLGKTFIKLSP